jgi:hypothetical protein
MFSPDFRLRSGWIGGSQAKSVPAATSAKRTRSAKDGVTAHARALLLRTRKLWFCQTGILSRSASSRGRTCASVARFFLRS